jgi:hypothetical protein
VFENGFLQRTSGTKWEDEKGEWRKLDSEELHIVYSSPDIIIQIKSRRVRWAGHVARMGEEQKGTMFYNVLQCSSGKARREETTRKNNA